VEVDGLSEINLMQRAGERVWREISSRWPDITRITIFAGSGNSEWEWYLKSETELRADKDLKTVYRITVV